MTKPRLRMLVALSDGQSMQRSSLFFRIGAHSSGYRALTALTEAGYVQTSFIGGCWCKITPAGLAAIKAGT